MQVSFNLAGASKPVSVGVTKKLVAGGMAPRRKGHGETPCPWLSSGAVVQLERAADATRALDGTSVRGHRETRGISTVAAEVHT